MKGMVNHEMDEGSTKVFGRLCNRWHVNLSRYARSRHKWQGCVGRWCFECNIKLL